MDLTKKQKEKIKTLVGDVSSEDEQEVRDRFKWAEKRAKVRGAAEGLLENLRTLWLMLTDPDYVMRWKTKAWIIAALAYFISPIDAIPDPIPGIGYLDDALVVAWVMHSISSEVAMYRKWRGLA